MEIQIIVMSILSYLILFNCSLTFRLNLKNNIVITTMLVFNIVLIREYIGSLFVIPMFTVISLLSEKTRLVMECFFNYFFIYITGCCR